MARSQSSPGCAILRQGTEEGRQLCTLLIFILTMNRPSTRLQRCWWKALLRTGQKHGQTWNLLWRKCENPLQQGASVGSLVMRMGRYLAGSVASASTVVM